MHAGMQTERERLTAARYDSATTRARAFRLSFISLISLSTSSMNLDHGSGIVLYRETANDALDDEVDDLVLQHGIRMVVRE